jgi:hypothetical protein
VTAEYPQKTITLEPEMQERVARLADEIKGPMRELAYVVAGLADIPLASDDTPAEVSFRVDLSGDGVLIIPLPTDPPLLACAFYHDGHYTTVEVPCETIPLVVH